VKVLSLRAGPSVLVCPPRSACRSYLAKSVDALVSTAGPSCPCCTHSSTNSSHPRSARGTIDLATDAPGCAGSCVPSVGDRAECRARLFHGGTHRHAWWEWAPRSNIMFDRTHPKPVSDQ
jgi:hypothetical protein